MKESKFGKFPGEDCGALHDSGCRGAQDYLLITTMCADYSNCALSLILAKSWGACST